MISIIDWTEILKPSQVEAIVHEALKEININDIFNGIGEADSACVRYELFDEKLKWFRVTAIKTKTMPYMCIGVNLADDEVMGEVMDNGRSVSEMQSP